MSPLPSINPAVAELRAAIEALEAENAQLREYLAYVVAQSSTGYARGSIRKPGAAR